MRLLRTSLTIVVFASIALALPQRAPAAAASQNPDANADGEVDLFDLVIVSSAYGPNEPATDPRADVNDDGIVDLFDLVLVSSRYGSTSSSRIPLPVPPQSSLFPEGVYSLHEEKIIGAYAVRVWRDAAASLPYSDVVTIDSYAHPRVQIEKFHAFDALHGSDVTGEGNPDAVIHTYSGGAHCCFRTIVYDLGQALTRVMRTAESNCDVVFLQLDSDPAYEAETCDDVFAYAYCDFAGSPLTKVVLDYTPGVGYLPASPRFPDVYSAAIAQHTDQAEQAVPAAHGEFDGTTKCSVLPVVLDWLYTGRTQTAWSELYRLYTYDDADLFRAEIEQEIHSSPLYTPY